MKQRKYCEFGKAILVKLAELNMTPKALAEKIHCERCQIYSYISGRHQPSMTTLMKLCIALNADISEMTILLENDNQQKG